ncbi:MAG TPA: SpoIIE family protein phosphatase, partial [Tepidisphaeraceae bacterium]|nr:SpoIIE family protein phosphatase [Tepidisphaeraceae bacterium]
LADAMFREVTAHAVTQARDHVLRVVPVARSLAALGDRGLTLNDTQKLAHQLVGLLRANPGVTWISYSDEAGTFTGAHRTASGTLRINQSWIEAGHTKLIEHDVYANDSWSIFRTNDDSKYDPRKRPFYIQARDAGRLVWLPPYIFYDEGVPGITCACPLFDQAGKMLGVLTFDFDLNALSQFAAGLTISQNSKVTLMTPEGVLLAHPSSQMNVTRGHMGEGTLPTVADVDDPAAKVFFEQLRPADVASGPDRYRQFEFNVAGTRYYAGAHSFQVEDGPVWIVGAMAPQSDFLAAVYRHNLASLGISAAAVLVAVVLAGLLARRVSEPVVGLVGVMNRVGSGDLDATADLGGSTEFRRLSAALNQMTSDLRDGMRLRSALAVAQEVQQKLLPLTPPNVAGLDVAGHTSYCDETGGDFYDWLVLDRETGGGVLVAIGDVVGHGIGAALLMATARGILRSCSLTCDSLGDVASHLNNLLVTDMRGGRFLTLCLALIDPKARTVRWSRAGHDPALIYDPDTGRFDELLGGGTPLGIDENIKYEEFSYAPLKPGQVIALGTDGIWEATNNRGEFFGKDRLRDAIRAAAVGSASDIVLAIRDAIDHFRGDQRQADDITFVVIKMTM